MSWPLSTGISQYMEVWFDLEKIIKEKQWTGTYSLALILHWRIFCMFFF